MNTELMFSSKTDMWSTPQDLFDKLNDEFHFDLDVCATSQNAKCEKYYTEEQDGLVQPWTGTVWCNPPYGRGMWKWVKKAAETSDPVVMLLPARTDTRWFHDYIYNKDGVEVRFLKGRLKFGNCKNAAPFPSMVVIFDEKLMGRYCISFQFYCQNGLIWMRREYGVPYSVESKPYARYVTKNKVVIEDGQQTAGTSEIGFMERIEVTLYKGKNYVGDNDAIFMEALTVMLNALVLRHPSSHWIFRGGAVGETGFRPKHQSVFRDVKTKYNFSEPKIRVIGDILRKGGNS